MGTNTGWKRNGKRIEVVYQLVHILAWRRVSWIKNLKYQYSYFTWKYEKHQFSKLLY